MPNRQRKYLLGMLVSLALMNMANALAEQKIYKYRDSEGGVLYSQERAGPGQLEAVIEVPPAPPPQARQEARRELQEAQARSQALAAQRLARQIPQERVRLAAQALEAAEIALQEGMEPKPGERLGTVYGTTRLSDAYWARMRALHLSVEIARERLTQATIDARLQAMLQ